MQHLTDAEIIEAVQSGCRTRKAVAAKLGCNRATIERRAKKSEEIATAFAEAESDVTDLAYDKLVEAIQAGRGWAIRFWLSTRDRGRFSTKLELDAGQQQSEIVILKIPDNGMGVKTE